ncbi:hypothetical protein [Streptomyces halstedii]|uniref:hypothetical protein n=1 Tax=Streptomyces halstedii TaxID=1944 RepID=UPI003351BDE2
MELKIGTLDSSTQAATQVTGPTIGKTRPAAGTVDARAGWTCDAGASLIAEAMTPGPGRLGTLHAVIYVCPDHQEDAEERMATAGYAPETRPAPPSHRWDPWPCGHVTSFSVEALATP